MRPCLLVAASLLLCLLGLRAAPLEADFASTLARASAGAEVQRLGAYHWLEGEGLATRLPPAPLAPGKGLALIAGEQNTRTGVALWRLDERGVEALRLRLRASLAPARDYNGLNGLGEAVAGKSHSFTLESGARGLLTVFAFGKRAYALVLSAPGGVGEDLELRRDAVLADLWPLAPTADDQLGLLLLEGRFAGLVSGYERAGRRLHRRAGRLLLSLSLFALSPREYGSRDALQVALEEKLRERGLRRTGGVTLPVAGSEAYCGEYFAPGTILRVLYAELGGDYLVGLWQGPESARELLRLDAEAFALSLKAADLPNADRPRPRPLAEATRLEVMAWQEGRRLSFGALFDTLWIESGVKYEARLTQNGRTLATALGSADASFELNPLGPAGPRSLNLPGDARGEAMFELKVGSLNASLRVTLK
ncbi:MAG: hypothetical protein BroJett014_30200 [Planctomycetota bacterium]|nr:MAG: hypothetical protein BroJett014_30200 [Planctomycetota bacterium]